MHVNILAQLVKEAVFSPYVFDPFVKNHITLDAQVSSCAFCFIPLVHMSVFVPESNHNICKKMDGTGDNCVKKISQTQKAKCHVFLVQEI